MNMIENDTKTQEINTDILTVRNNIIEFKNYFIQISNVSEVEIAPIPKKPYPLLGIILSLIGVLVFFMGIGKSAPAIIMGLIIFAIGAFMLYKVYQKNQNRGEVLILGLNYGRSFYFRCNDEAFLKKVLNVLKSCINAENQQVTFDFRESKITNSPIISGSENNVTMEGII